MAIKDSILNQVLKSETTTKSSQALYKRLREPPILVKNEQNSAKLNTTQLDTVKPSLTQFNAVESGLTGLNSVQLDLQNSVQPNLTQFNQVQPRSIDQVKPSLTQFKNLHGNPRKVLEFLLASILDFNEFITEQLPVTKIAENVGLSRDSVKSALKFLIKNDIVKRIDFFAGIHGWAQYSIHRNAFSLVQNVIKTGFNPVKQIGSNNSNNNLNTTIINDPWDEIDFSSLVHIGFEKSTLLQLKNYSTPEIVQASINYFAFQYNHENGKYKLSALISTLKAGEAWQRHPEYKTPQEAAIERIRQEVEEGRKRAKQQEDELFEIKFNEWFIKLSNEDKRGKDISELQSEFRRGEWLEIKKAWA